MNTAPADGWWWYRLPASTPGWSDRHWSVARVLHGAVQPHGSTAWYKLTASRFRDAEWVPAQPPAGGEPPDATITTDWPATRRQVAVTPDREERVRRVAAEVVDVFLGLSDSMAAYYRRHPGRLADLVAVVTRIILKLSRR